jgi:hypothetical protein
METLKVEPTGIKDYGPCKCCGNDSRCVWGFVYSRDATIASYFVHWALGHVVDHDANFDLMLGRWGEEAPPEDRYLVSLSYRLSGSGPSFMVIDAMGRPAADSELVGRVLRRSEVVDKTIAREAFAVADAVLAQDTRLAELLGR